MQIDLEVLGLSQERLREMVVETIVDRLMHSTAGGEEGERCYIGDSQLKRALDESIKVASKEQIAALFDLHVLPNIKGAVEGLVLQETTTWGEKVGKPVTFIEYLIQRADAYLREQVNYEGKDKAQSGGYSWSPSQTRITHLVHQHLHSSIETAMKQAMAGANSAIVGGIQETVKLKLAEIAAKLQVTAKVP